MTVVVIAIATVIGIDFLRDETMSTPDPPDPDAVVVLTLDVDTREAFGSVDDVVEALYVACRVRLPDETQLLESTESADGLGRLVVAPAVGATVTVIHTSVERGML